MTKYATNQGDAWDLIALKTLDDESYMDLIVDANPLHRETIIFAAGIEIDIPTVVTPKPKKLPPWKRS